MEPVRTCVGCHTRRRQSELIRIARRPDGVVAEDGAGDGDGSGARTQGRGVYVCRDRGCVERAVRSGGVRRGLRLEGPEPPGLEADLLRTVGVDGDGER